MFVSNTLFRGSPFLLALVLLLQSTLPATEATLQTYELYSNNITRGSGRQSKKSVANLLTRYDCECYFAGLPVSSSFQGDQDRFPSSTVTCNCNESKRVQDGGVCRDLLAENNCNIRTDTDSKAQEFPGIYGIPYWAIGVALASTAALSGVLMYLCFYVRRSPTEAVATSTDFGPAPTLQSTDTQLPSGTGGLTSGMQQTSAQVAPVVSFPPQSGSLASSRRSSITPSQANLKQLANSNEASTRSNSKKSVASKLAPAPSRQSRKR